MFCSKCILKHTEMKHDVIQISPKIDEMKKLLSQTGTILYRGTGLTKKELQDYRDKVGNIQKDEECYGGPFKSGHTTLTGFISTSMKRSSAQKFAWANETTGHEATVFEIMWKHRDNYYLMDMSAFPEEKEVLLSDGSRFEVI